LISTTGFSGSMPTESSSFSVTWAATGASSVVFYGK
jgi:hypothetical protein